MAGTTALGVWQSQRYYWKLEQIDQRAATLARDPVPLPTCVDGIDTRLLAGLLIISYHAINRAFTPALAS